MTVATVAIAATCRPADAQEATATVGTGLTPSAVAVDLVTNKTYIANAGAGTVTVIDGATNTASTVTVGSNPVALAVDPVTNTVYVANAGGNNVSVIAGATATVPATVAVAVAVGTTPSAIAVDPVTNKVYVADSGSGDVCVIDGATNIAATPVSAGGGPAAIAVNQVTNTVYVANKTGGNVTVIAGATATTAASAIASVTTGTSPSALAVNPVTNTIYVGNAGSGNVTVINGANNQVTATVSAGTSPSALAVNPVTNTIYVANSGSSNVTVIAGATNAVTASISSSGTTPDAIAVNPTTNTVYLANAGSGNVTVISGASNALATIPTISAGSTPIALAVNPVTDKIYVANSGSGNVTVVDGAANAISTVGTGNVPFYVAVNPSSNLSYIANYSDNTVTVISNATNTVLTTVSLPTSGGSNHPLSIAINPVTNLIYVANQDETVAVINGATNHAASTPIAVTNVPLAMAVNPVTDRIYVTNSGTTTLSVINGGLNTTASTISINVGRSPLGVAVNPVTNTIYVANNADNTVTVISGANNTPTATVSVGTNPSAIAVNPVTNKVYVTNENSGNVTVIDGVTNATATVTVGATPNAIAVNPANNKIYVTNENSGNVTVIDGATNIATSTASSANVPFAVAINETTNKIYVANEGSSAVTVIDGATNTVTSATAAGSNPATIAVNPLNNAIYVPDETANLVTVITEQPVQTIPLTASITPLNSTNKATNTTPTFTFNAASSFSPTAPAPQAVFFQVDTWQGAWTQAASAGSSFSGTVAALQPGDHVIYAYASDGQDATSVQLDSPLVSAVTAYEFYVPPPATHFRVVAPASATAGTAFGNVVVTALDVSNNTVPGYTGTVHFTSSDSQAVLPANVTLTNGTKTVTVTLKTAGTQIVTATDTVNPTITGVSADINVSPGAATHFSVSAPGTSTAGVALNVTVTALDVGDNVATGYTGTVRFTSSDSQAELPANSTLTNGVGTFSATLLTAGNRTVTAVDTVTSSITGTSGGIAVSPGAAIDFTVSAPGSATAGAAINVTVKALDSWGNTASGYLGTVHFTSTDGLATLPADTTLTNGLETFAVTLRTAGGRTVTATDTVNPSITGASGNINVGPGVATHFQVAAPGSSTAGTAFSLTVTALDDSGNTATGYAGTVHFTSSDGQAALPGNATLTSGVKTFTATLKTAGMQTVTATDTVNSSISGTSGSVAVAAGAATHLTVSAPGSATAGTAFNTLAVTALDASGNTAVGYTGTVHFTSTDSQAVLPANATLTAGTGTFSVTLKTAGARTVTATDTVTPSINGTSGSITVNPGAATRLTVSAPGSATAGSSFDITVTALDSSGNTATAYAGTVHFTSTDSQAVLPADTTLTSGVETFGATLKTAGTQTLAATDTVTSSITGTSGGIAVAPGAATHFTVTAPGSATAGTAFSNLMVTALDASGNTAAGYSGTVHFTSSDSQAVLPADTTLTSGAGTFAVTLQTAGTQTVTATDTVTSSITGSSASITVAVGATTHFSVNAPGSATAGTAFNLTVTALDVGNNLVASYAGAVHFTSTDSQAVLPANTTLTSGVGTFAATLKTAGVKTLTATDTVNSSITGTSAGVTVGVGLATHFLVSAPGAATAGTAFNFTVTAQDVGNNTATGYTGTAHFTSSDGQAVLPANATLTSGVGTFAATLKTAGTQTVTATDTTNASITGVSGNVTVGAGAATHFSVSAPGTATAGTPFNFAVTALDVGNNIVSGYSGTAHFTSSDAQAVLPANATLTGGVGTFAATLKTAGLQTVTATDTVTLSIAGTSGGVSVAPGAATTFSIVVPGNFTAGTAFNVEVTALDGSGNVATGYSGTIHFTSSDISAVLPANATLTNGAGTFSVTLETSGTQTISVTDTVTSSITDTSANIVVGFGTATHFTVSAPGSATAGTVFNVTVTALDSGNNTVTAYAGTVHFTSSDGQAVLPADATLTNGTGTFSTTLKTAGTQTVTATDTVTSSITGASSGIAVGPGAATHFTVSAPGSATAGTAFNVTVTALDVGNNVAAGYAGAVHFTSGDAQAALPANGTLTSGTGIFSAALKTAGTQTVTATDTVSSSIDGISGNITVGVGAATHFSVSAPGSATAGTAFNAVVTALDVGNNPVPGYAGTVHFTSSDSQAVLPANATLTNGVGTFSWTLKTAAGETVTATDTVTSSITGTSGGIAVAPGGATHFSVSTPSSATAGTAFNFTVTALDVGNNTATGYAGTVQFTSSDSQAVLAANGTLTSGVGTFSATLKTAATQTVTATDTVTSSITGISGNITVGIGVATHFTVSAPGSATAGVAFNATVTALDSGNNPVTSYAGTVHFTSSDTQAVPPANATLTGGTGTFSWTLKTAATETVTATDTVTTSITGTSGNIIVGAGAATHFTVSAPASAIAGTAFNVTVTALDVGNNTATAYAGLAHFASSDGQAVLPANAPLTDGTGTFSWTLRTAATETVTATDSVTPSITGTSGNIAVAPGAATHFTVSAPGSATVGTAISVTVTALDGSGNTATGYAGTVRVTSSDGHALLPANGTLASGVGTFPVTFQTAGSQTVTGTDTVSSIAGTSAGIAVGAGTATHFSVSGPGSATAGTAFNVIVTALDVGNNTVTGYAGTVHFASSDSQAALPANATLTNGTGSFPCTLKTAMGETVTATDTVISSITGTSATITVAVGAATHFTVSAPASATAGAAFNVIVTALDTGNNTVTAYAGIVHFTSSDSQAVLPANAALTNGTGSFPTTLQTAGIKTVTATDTVTSSITGTSGNVTVGVGAATHFSVSVPGSATAGTAFNVTVTALDIGNNTVTGYAGTVGITSSDGQALLPADAGLVNGAGVFPVTLLTAAAQTVTATDTVTSSITGTSGTIMTSAGPATHYSVVAPATFTSGTAFSVTVTALDNWGNTATGYSGTVHFTTSDPSHSPSLVLPADTTLAQGTGTFPATLLTGPTQTITATDTVTSSITGTSDSITEGAGTATHFSVSAAGSATAGAAFNVTVTALDSGNNTVSSYAGTVRFSSSDGHAVLPANAALTNGVGIFSATLLTAGTQTVTATDTVTASITGSSGSITVVVGAATHFTVSAPSTATAGTAFNVTVTALDVGNNPATGYAGMVHFTSSDGQAVLPANGTLTSGTGIFSATLKTAGTQTVTATDTVTSSVTGISGSIAVAAGAATHFTVTAPGSATAGTAFNYTVTALDASGNPAAAYAGTVHFTSSDGEAVLPANATLTSGLGSFSATLKTAGSRTVTATDTVTSSITGTSGGIVVNPSAATHFTVSAPGSATAGTAFNNLTVTAVDSFGNTATGYAGTAHFTSSDSQALLPANATLTSGTGTFSATLKTAGTQTVTATDTVTTSITGVSGSVTVAPGAATSFTVSAPASAVAGTPFNVMVTAFDGAGNIATGYAGTVRFTSSDGQAVLPANTTLTSGAGTFAATLKTAAAETVTATDTVTSSITGMSGNIAVSPGAATHFSVTTPATFTPNTAFNVTVTALDASGNVATGYAGIVRLTSSDGAATLPANAALTNGAKTFSATLQTGPTQTITATDTVTSSITGTSNSIAEGSGTTTHFLVSAPGSATAGIAFSVTVTALDSGNNPVAGYAGTVHFTSSDGQAVLPGNATLTSGTGTFSTTLKTAGTQTVTATDTVTSSITGVSAGVTVSAGAATHFAVGIPASATAGTAFDVMVTALDSANNLVTGYAGTAHFTSSDSQAVLPADATLTNGTGTFLATLKTAGTQTVTATDTVFPSITGTSASSTVAAGAATHFSVSAPGAATAGVALSLTVTALDVGNNTVAGYIGEVHFTSSDGQALLPANATLTNGVRIFPATLRTAGLQTVTATDTVTSSITGVTSTISVVPGLATQFLVTAPGSATARTAVNIVMTALDASGNTVTGYAGTVQFTSSDGSAVLPPNSSLTAGTGTFPVTFETAGTQTVTATDTVTAAITGTSANIAVSVAPATHFLVSAPGSATAGTAFNVTVTALDSGNNAVPTYSGTVHFASSDGPALLPGNATLTSGAGTFPMTLETAGVQTVTATDTVTSSITGTSGSIAVGAGLATHFLVSAPGSATVGTAFNFTVTALDGGNNAATGYAGTVHFTSSDGQAVLPANATLTSGAGTFAATLRTAGTQTVSATDTVTSSITGSSASISVIAVNPTFSQQPSSQTVTAGSPVTLSVSAAGGGLALTYRWQVSIDGGRTWTNLTDGGGISGSATPNLLISAAAGWLNGYEYQCIVTSSAGSSISSAATVTVTAASAPTAYFGTIGSGSGSSSAGLRNQIEGNPGVGTNLAAEINADGTGGTMIGYISSLNAGFAVSFTLSPSGSFSARTGTLTGGASPSETLTFNGQVTSGTISGTIAELSLPFSATLDASSGSTAALSDFYQAAAIGSSGTIYSVVGTQGEVYVLTVTASGVSAGVGTVSGGGAVSVTTQNGATVAGTVTASSDTLTGTVTQSAGGVVSFSGAISVPSFTVNPVAQTVASGRSVAFNATASGSPGYQWTLNGAPISGATDPILLAGDATAGGSYACVATNALGSTTSTAAALTVITTSNGGRLINLSARAFVTTGNNILIGGFAVGGTGTKQLLVRATGPALSIYFNNELAMPELVLLDNTGAVVASDIGWGNALTIGSSTAAEAPVLASATLQNTLGAFQYAAGSGDSAMVLTMPAGNNTAQLSGVGGTTGIAVCEIYDADLTTPTARLINISARADVLTGNNILIGGFVVGGSTADTVLIRAIGPGLNDLYPTIFPLSTILNQPVLSILDVHGNVIYSNTVWGGDATLTSVFNTVGAFSLNPAHADSAVLVTLPPGNYTAQVSGLDSGTGIANCEIYEVP